MIKMKIIQSLLILSTLAYVQPIGLKTLQDIAKAGSDTGKGIAKKIPDIIPSPEALFKLGLDGLVGLPLQAFVEAINQICNNFQSLCYKNNLIHLIQGSLALSANATSPRITPNINELNFVFFTENENVSIPILKSEDLWTHPKFNTKYNVTVLVTGWASDIGEQNSAVDSISEAYKARGKNNFIVLDTAKFVDTLYTWSALNTEELGSFLGKALAKLNQKVPLSKIHLIGHSLGSHISGSAGRTFYEITKRHIPRITGLDPANPCFNEGESLSGLQRGDAEFIDVIHSNSGVLGQRAPLGDVDFYPNGATALQPGCFDPTCSHSRAWELYAETVYPGNELNFKAIRCNSLFSLDSGRCPGDEIQMGFDVPTNIKGNYFLKTKSSTPFGFSFK